MITKPQAVLPGQPVVPPVQPLIPGLPWATAINWSHFKPEFSGKPDDDAGSPF